MLGNNYFKTSINQISRLGSYPIREVLDFSHNDLSVNGIQALVKKLVYHPYPITIHGLVLRGNVEGLNDEGMKAIGYLLERNNYLRTLDLSYNNLSVQSIKILGQSLRNNTHLVELDLSHNAISSMSNVATLYDGLMGNTRLEILNLSHSQLSYASFFCLTGALIKNRTLRILLLNNCGLNDHFAEGFAKDILTQTALLEINLASNSITKEGCRHLIAALKINKNLPHLILDWDKLEETQRQTIQAGGIRLSYNWAGAALFMLFQSVNRGSPLRYSVLPLIDTVQKMVWGDPSLRSSVLSPISDIQKRVQESLTTTDSILSQIKSLMDSILQVESLQNAKSAYISAFRNSIKSLDQSIKKVGQDNLELDKAVLALINLSQISKQNNILQFKNSVSSLKQYIESMKENDLDLEKSVSSLIELMKQDISFSKIKTFIFTQVNKNQEKPQISPIESIERVTSRSRSTLKEMILPLVDSIQMMAQGNMLVTAPTGIRRVEKFDSFSDTRFCKDHHSTMPNYFRVIQFKIPSRPTVDPLRYYKTTYPIFYSFIKQNDRFRIVIRYAGYTWGKIQSTAETLPTGEILLTEEISDYWHCDKAQIETQAQQRTWITENVRGPWKESELASPECVKLSDLGCWPGFLCCCCLCTIPLFACHIESRLGPVRERREILDREIQRLTDKFMQRADEQASQAIAEMLKKAEEILKKRGIPPLRPPRPVEPLDVNAIAKMLEKTEQVLKKRGTPPPRPPRPEYPGDLKVRREAQQIQRVAPPPPPRPGYNSVIAQLTQQANPMFEVKMTREEEEIRDVMLAMLASQQAEGNINKALTMQFDSQKYQKCEGNNSVVAASAASIGKKG